MIFSFDLWPKIFFLEIKIDAGDSGCGRRRRGVDGDCQLNDDVQQTVFGNFLVNLFLVQVLNYVDVDIRYLS
jgi:hypothetical protein